MPRSGHNILDAAAPGQGRGAAEPEQRKSFLCIEIGSWVQRGFWVQREGGFLCIGRGFRVQREVLGHRKSFLHAERGFSVHYLQEGLCPEPGPDSERRTPASFQLCHGAGDLGALHVGTVLCVKRREPALGFSSAHNPFPGLATSKQTNQSQSKAIPLQGSAA